MSKLKLEIEIDLMDGVSEDETKELVNKLNKDYDTYYDHWTDVNRAVKEVIKEKLHIMIHHKHKKLVETGEWNKNSELRKATTGNIQKEQAERLYHLDAFIRPHARYKAVPK